MQTNHFHPHTTEMRVLLQVWSVLKQPHLSTVPAALALLARSTRLNPKPTFHFVQKWVPGFDKAEGKASCKSEDPPKCRAPELGVSNILNLLIF